MQGLRSLFAAALTISLAAVPLLAGPTTTSVLGTVVTAQKAHVGEGAAAVGTTVYGGDRLTPRRQACTDSCGRSFACCS